MTATLARPAARPSPLPPAWHTTVLPAHVAAPVGRLGVTATFLVLTVAAALSVCKPGGRLRKRATR